MEAVRHLYVHIPFCARICPYCAFYKTLPDRAYAHRFCEAVLRELDNVAAPLQLETIYFGGGTPTALSRDDLRFLLEGFRQRLDLGGLKEWTVEANPGSVSLRKATGLRELGVSRLSLGVQSWNDDGLQLLGREHNASQARESFATLRAAGFANLNIDLMFGLPGQTVELWRDSLLRTVELQPEHISTYCLTFEEDTEFFLRHARGEFREDSDAEAVFFETATATLEEAGYHQYEISNYARPGFESIHNRAYWSGRDYIGLGPGAFSTVGGMRWRNLPDYRGYSDRLLTGQPVVESTESLSDQMKATERLALSLRTREGVPVEWLAAWPEKKVEFVTLGLMQQNGRNVRLTRKGRLLADEIAAAFV